MVPRHHQAGDSESHKLVICVEKHINDIYTNCRGELKLPVFMNVTRKSWDRGLCIVYSDKALGWMAEE
jgi:hypothetical protein